MNIPTKKLRSGFEMPVFGFGTWQMGRREDRNPLNDDEADIRAIQTGIDAGLTHIDTAEKYAAGYTEILTGQAIKKYDRSKLFLVSKVGSPNMSYDGILTACEASLTRLDTSYLDAYLLHRYNPNFLLKDSMRALDRLVDEGVIKNIGVCNFGPRHLTEAQTHSTHKIMYDQVHYNLMYREPEHAGLLEYCQQNDIFLMAWRPVGKGALLETVPAVVQEMCEKYQKTPAQIAINWLISQPNVITLSKMRHKEHLHENLGALGWGLTTEDIEKIRREFPNQHPISDVVPLG